MRKYFSIIVFLPLVFASCSRNTISFNYSTTHQIMPTSTNIVTTINTIASIQTTQPPTFPAVIENQPASTALPTSAQEPLSTITPETIHIPNEYYITNITGRKQYFPLGCETSVAVDWAQYFGVEINEFEFQTRLPLSDNPDLGFVGSVESPWGQVPPYGYGVHAYPIAELLRGYGLNAVGVKNYSVELIKEQISTGKPVIAWVIGNCVGGIPHEYTDSQGNKVIVAAYEHVIIITGYDQANIRYMNNGNFYEVPTEIFENSWSVLERMVVFLDSQ